MLYLYSKVNISLLFLVGKNKKSLIIQEPPSRTAPSLYSTTNTLMKATVNHIKTSSILEDLSSIFVQDLVLILFLVPYVVRTKKTHAKLVFKYYISGIAP